MNKILLIYPSFLNKEEETEVLYTDLPLSVITLGAQLKNNGYEVEIIDECLEMITDEVLYNKLEGCFMVGISAITSFQIVNGLTFAKKIKRYNAKVNIVWGGWHASLMPEQTIAHEFIDIVITGPGEEQIVEVADHLKRKESLRDIPNLIFKNREEQIRTHKKEYDNFLLKNNIIDGYKLIDVERYIHEQWGNKRVLGYESSRGCCCQCQFCSISSLYHGKWFGLPAEDVYKDIAYLKRNHNIDAVHFFDNNFFVNKKRVMGIADLFQSHRLDIKWDGTIIIPQFLTYSSREIERLKKSGLYRIIAGIESGDANVLKKIHKRHTNEQVLESVHRCKEHGLLPSFSFMLGFPWEPEADTENTIELVQKIKEINPMTEILMFIFSPYLGTPLYYTALEHGMSFPDTLEGWARFTYERANTPWLSKRLCKKIERYLGFFGTKELSESEKRFYDEFHSKDFTIRESVTNR